MVRRFGIQLKYFLNRPSYVFVVCALFLGVSLIFDGILWRLWGLQRDYERRNTEIHALQGEIQKLDQQLKQARDPAFIERQARDRLDLADGNDLVFVFPEE